MIDASTQKKILKAVGYTGRRVELKAFKPMSLNSYWEEGAIDYYHFVDLLTFNVRKVPSNGSAFHAQNLRAEVLEANTVIVNTGVFLGKPTGATIYFKQ